VALGAGPQLLMLDEPAAGLNTQEAQQLGHVLKSLIGDGVEAILLVEHNMALVMEVSDRIVVLKFWPPKDRGGCSGGHPQKYRRH